MCGQVSVQPFQGDDAIEARVASFVHLAHTAGAEQRAHFVGTKAIACGERPRVWPVCELSQRFVDERGLDRFRTPRRVVVSFEIALDVCDGDVLFGARRGKSLRVPAQIQRVDPIEDLTHASPRFRVPRRHRNVAYKKARALCQSRLTVRSDVSSTDAISFNSRPPKKRNSTTWA